VSKEALVAHLLQHSVKVGRFTLKSGRTSTWFIDAKQTICRPDGLLLVAESDGRLVGAITLFRDWRGAQEGAAHVRLLAVPPQQRGAGVGRALMEHSIGIARSDRKHRIVLTVTQEMEHARDLTERMGFIRAPELDHEPAPGVRLEGWQLKLEHD